MPDWFSDNAPKAATSSGGGDWFDLYSPSRKPVSAEDFAPPAPSKGWPAKLGDAFKGFGKSVVSGAVGTAEALSDLQRAGMMGDTEASARTLARVKALGQAQADEFTKAAAAPTLSEKLGHAGAGILPVLGPAAAHAGEDIAAGNAEGYGEAAALVAPFGPAEFAAKGIPPALRAAQTAGKAMGSAAMKAAPVVGPIALDVAAHHFGGPPVFTAVKILKSVLDESRKAPDAAAETPAGRLSTDKAPTLTKAMTGILDELRQPEPPARITTPPPAGLPPGYTPRTTAPKPRIVPRPAPVATETPGLRITGLGDEAPAAPVAADPKRLYFLKPPSELAPAAREAVTPSDFTDPTQLPASWRTRTDQPLMKLTTADIDEMAGALRESGISPADAIKAVAKNSSLPPNVRVELLTTLGRITRQRK